jgi:hypothetical protein
MRGAAATAAAILGAVLLAGCGSDDTSLAAEVATQLPDLSGQGYTSFECGDGEAIGDSFQEPEDATYVAQCWVGSPDGTYLDAAQLTHNEVLAATGGVDVTGNACLEDSLNVAGGIACRAAYVQRDGQAVLVRTVVVLADPLEVLGELPEDPSQEEVFQALAGAKVEILVGTEPTTGNSSATPAATS